MGPGKYSGTGHRIFAECSIGQRLYVDSTLHVVKLPNIVVAFVGAQMA